MESDIAMDATDVRVEPIGSEPCACEDAMIDHEIWLDLRTAGMSVMIGRYCKQCADEIAMRIRMGLPVLPAPEAKP